MARRRDLAQKGIKLPKVKGTLVGCVRINTCMSLANTPIIHFDLYGDSSATTPDSPAKRRKLAAELRKLADKLLLWR